MFDQLSSNLEGVLKKLRGQGKITEKNVSDAMREVRMALLEADVDFKVAKEFVAAVRDKALGEAVLRSVTPGQQVVKIFQDELTAVLGGEAAGIDLNPPARILMVGLNGAGKTTSSAKLALRLKNEGRRPLLVALDLYRPAAIDQLETLADEIGVPMFRPAEGERDVLRVARQALEWIKLQNGSVVIFDTAGRQEIDEELVAELAEVRKLLDPNEVLLVVDAATGQQAVQVAQTFDQEIGVTGIALTKLDGDARGGAALSMRRVTGKPIKFAGVGEKMDQFEEFYPDRLAGRILGMGDVVSLVEKAAEAVDEEDALRMADKLKKGGFDLNDFLDQMKMMRKLGPLEGILGMLPGMGSKLKGMDLDEKRMLHVEAIILSMTPKERSRPAILNGSRRKRIALGSGRPISEVNRLLKQFSGMQKMMKSKGKMKRMMKEMGMGGGGGFPGLPGM